jgi:hypothetical protein
MPSNGQPLADPVNMFYSYDFPGVAHMVYLSNYIPFDTWGTDSVQYKWLAADLAKVDRKVSRQCNTAGGTFRCILFVRCTNTRQHVWLRPGFQTGLKKLTEGHMPLGAVVAGHASSCIKRYGNKI